MLKHLLTRRATILNPTSAPEDAFSDAVEVFTDDSGHTWACRVDPAQALENEINRDTITTWFNLVLTERARSTITGRSRAVVDGITYQVVGDPKVFYLRKRPSHVEASVRIIKG